jgi:predicted transcriptional regulator
MASTLKETRKSSKKAAPVASAPATGDVTVYGHLDRRTLDAVDRVAEQMLMPRSWVVTQILREWAERRSAEIHELEESWNGSYREELGRQGLDGPCEDCKPI